MTDSEADPTNLKRDEGMQTTDTSASQDFIKPLRIDLVFPRFKLLSGAERAILGLAGALAADGHSVRIVCHQFDPSCKSLLQSKVTLVCSHVKLDWSSNRYLNAALDYLRCFSLGTLLDDEADAFVLFGPSLPLVLYLQKIRPCNASVLYYCWEPPRVLFQDRKSVLDRVGWRRIVVSPGLRLYSVLDRWFVSLADAVCTSSSFAADQIKIAYGCSASVITLGVDRDRLDTGKDSLRSEPPVVLTVNYLHPRKRINLFIEAAEILRSRWTNAASRPKWIIVGDGPERDQLKLLTQRLSLDLDIEFAGFVSDEMLPKYYAVASCYVHTAVEESLGLSVIEAAYCECPVIAVNEGGLRQTVKPGVTGYLVSAQADEIATSVELILQTEGLVSTMGRAGKELVSSQFQWEKGASDIVQLVQAVKE